MQTLPLGKRWLAAGREAATRSLLPHVCSRKTSMRRQHVVLAAQQGNPAEDFAKQAQDFARRTSKSVSDFVRDQELDKKAAAAYEDASQQLRTNYMKLDADWDIAGRFNNAQQRLSEKAQVC